MRLSPTRCPCWLVSELLVRGLLMQPEHPLREREREREDRVNPMRNVVLPAASAHERYIASGWSVCLH